MATIAAVASSRRGCVVEGEVAEERRARWLLRPAEEVADLARALGVSRLLALLLAQRGLRTPAEADRFLHAEREPLHDPGGMLGLEPAAARLARAVSTGEQIGIFADYDADGVVAAAVLVHALAGLGRPLLVHIPHRLRDGYGLNLDGLRRLRQGGVSLLVTVDCGITATEEVEAAREMGMEVIVTDHHHVPARLPAALAVINPHQPGCPYPFKDLAGAGVAFKLAQATLRLLLGEAEGDRRAELLLDLVALGTVADMVPLLGENRTIVRRGLSLLNRGARPGPQALAQAAGIRPGAVDAASISFRLGPRLNAAGRLDDARVAFDLLVAPDLERARPLAARLNEANRERQRLTDEAVALVRQQVLASRADEPGLVIAGSFSAGIVGLVAAQVVQEFYRPTIILERGEHESRGSARSVPDFNIVEALAECADLLVRYGGHAQAAGLTVRNDRLPAFAARFVRRVAARLGERPRGRVHLADALVRPRDLSLAVVDELARLEPHGIGNPTPLLATRGVRLLHAQAIKERYLKLWVTDGAITLPAMVWRPGSFLPRPGDSVDLLYRPTRSQWNGEEELVLEVEDLAASATPALVA